MIRLLTFLALSAVSADALNAQTTFFSSEPAWLSALAPGAPIAFPFTPSNVLLANEVGTTPSCNQRFGPRFTFDASNTELPTSFRFEVGNAATHDACFVCQSFIGACGGGDHDWDLEGFVGDPVHALALRMPTGIAVTQYTVKVYDQQSALLGSTPLSPQQTFLGISSTTVIARVRFEDIPDAGGVVISEILFPGGPVCQPDLGFQGPGAATASLCGSGLNLGESSDYEITDAEVNAPGALLISSPNQPNITLFPTANPGVLMSGAGLVFAAPVVADQNGELSIPINGIGTPADLVFQTLLFDSTVAPHNVAFTNAIQAEFGQ